MLDPARLAVPPIGGADLDKARRLSEALRGLAELLDAAGDLSGVRADRFSALVSCLADPLAEELEALTRRADGEAGPPAASLTFG